MKENKIQRVAAINVGSNYIEMIIAEVFKNGEYFILEDIEKPISIGKSSFSEGKINAECISHTCDILNKFIQLMKEYRVKTYKAVATTGVREADNRDYVLEQIKARCGMEIDILSNSMVRYYKHKALEEDILNISDYYNKGVCLIDIESGSVHSKIFRNGQIYKASHAPIGPLRIIENFYGIMESCDIYSDVINTYIKNKLSIYETDRKNLICNTIILIGSQIDILRKFVKIKNDNVITKKEFLVAYGSIKNLSMDRISEKYNITKNKCETLVSICNLINAFIEITDASTIKISFISLKQGILLQVIDEQMQTKGIENSYEIIKRSANYVEKKYKGYIENNNYVERYALELFDRSKNIHKLIGRDRIYLSIACKLMNIVPSLGLIDNEILSYNIVYNEEIEGISDDEMKIIANIIRYQEDLDPYEDLAMTNLKRVYRLKVAKLSAILRIAKSLGISRKDKYIGISISVGSNEINIKTRSKDNCVLENWSMSKNKMLFEEVMGYKVIFKNIIEYGE